MELPTEFLTIEQALTLPVLGAILFFIVQATKELPLIRGMPTLLYAWILAVVLLFTGTVIRQWPSISWAETIYLSILNGLLVAGTAVLTHQAGQKLGILKPGVLGESK